MASPVERGAGMLRGIATTSGPATGVGASSVMNMNQEGLGDYQMRSEVIAFEAGRKLSRTWRRRAGTP